MSSLNTITCAEEHEPRPSTCAPMKLSAQDMRLTRKYAHDFIEELIGGNVPPPNGGDCFYCQFRITDTDHIVIHVSERCYVPSLLVRAVELHEPSPLALYILFYCVWGEDDVDLDMWGMDVAKHQLRASLRTYVRSQWVTRTIR